MLSNVIHELQTGKGSYTLYTPMFVRKLFTLNLISGDLKISFIANLVSFEANIFK